MAIRKVPPIIGFFEDFDIDEVASDVRSLKSQRGTNSSIPKINKTLSLITEAGDMPPIGSDVVANNTSDNVTQDESLRQNVRTSDNVTQDESERQNVTTSEAVTHDAPERHYVTTSGRHYNEKIAFGITRPQAAVLSWLIQECGTKTNIVTYRMGSCALSVTERAIRTQIQALSKKGFILEQTAFRPNSRHPIGKAITIHPSAYMALALFQKEYTPDVVTHNKSERQNVTTSGIVTYDKSERQTVCSSILTTTTEQNFDEQNNELLDSLILDDWEKWGLRPHLISSFADKGLSIIQEILDKTAYVINKKNGSPFEIKNRIGFLKKCLAQEFCEVDNDFVSRKEKIKLKRIEQLKEEARRIEKLKLEEQNAAINVVKAGLSEDEIEDMRKLAIKNIQNELKNPTIEPNGPMIESYLRKLFLGKAKEMKII